MSTVTYEDLYALLTQHDCTAYCYFGDVIVAAWLEYAEDFAGPLSTLPPVVVMQEAPWILPEDFEDADIILKDDADGQYYHVSLEERDGYVPMPSTLDVDYDFDDIPF